ncbi:hypothetical protein PO124_32055 [Bacillus licheniformis]|nr:hypothetical protein [Bacillus licheniformis]
MVNTLRGNYSSSNPAKAISTIPARFAGKTIRSLFQRLSPSSILIRTKTEVSKRTHERRISQRFAMAYAIPERYQELLTRASELGHNRIVAGMHSPLDVMGDE